METIWEREKAEREERGRAGRGGREMNEEKEGQEKDNLSCETEVKQSQRDTYRGMATRRETALLKCWHSKCMEEHN